MDRPKSTPFRLRMVPPKRTTTAPTDGSSSSASGLLQAQQPQEPQEPQQDQPTSTSIGDDASSEWETEDSNESGDMDTDGSDTHESIESDDPDSDDDMDSDDWDAEDSEGDTDDDFGTQPFMFNPIQIDIEKLQPSLRAARRSAIEDVMSDFSGDEKYEPKGSYSGVEGEGDMDMVDRNPVEDSGTSDGGLLSCKIRQLMIRLTKGRKDRERKLNIDTRATQSSSSSHSATTPSGAYLHRLVVRGPDHPREVVRSPAVSFHYQCANSLVVTPSVMGASDDIFTISANSIMRCGVVDILSARESMASPTPRSRHRSLVKYYQHRVFKPYADELETVRATKFIRASDYRFNDVPFDELYLPFGRRVLCVAHKYGYLAYGTSSGYLIVHCTVCGKKPIRIFNDCPDGHGMSMLNSIQIVRWPRYQRKRDDQDGDNSADWDYDDDAEETNHADAHDHDLEEGFPTPSTEYDHYMVMTLNQGGLLIAALPDHPKEHNGRKLKPSERDNHELMFVDNTLIKNGFRGKALNDARVSPNGRWIAAVGDAQNVWTIEITHVPETEQERIDREAKERETMFSMDTDSDFVTEDSLSDDDDDDDDDMQDPMNLDMESDLNKNHGEKRPFNMIDTEDTPEGSGSSSKSPKPMQAPRLVRKFGDPVEMHIPDKVLHGALPKNTRRRRHGLESYSSQYVAWNATSTKFAHSSDVNSRVMVWSMPSRQMICCVDIGGTGYSIKFHPKLENLFAVANRYGFVHVVDITGSCIGDEDLIPSNDRYDGQTQCGPSLSSECEGPHYEEKHDILMLSFRGEKDTTLRILDGIRGLGWSTDGRHLYVATLRRVLRYELADNQIRIPSLFQMCAQVVREWKEKVMNQKYTNDSDKEINEEFGQLSKEWKYVPYPIKRRIWGDMFLMR
ncbi:hypothetical protein B0O80DRAFT_447371 [Mortierella sp. GBAus27b]|nr:hypothetical protein B0O80DRAFT_447371 [Mortierella sp. GBAus27b]